MGEGSTCAACAAPRDASQAGDGDGGTGGTTIGSAGGVGDPLRPRRGTHGRQLCAAAALSRLRRGCRRGSAILPAMLVVAGFSGRPLLRQLFLAAAVRDAGRVDPMRCLSGGSAAVRWRAGGRRLWCGGANRRAAPEIWAARGSCAADGTADGTAAGGARTRGGDAARAGALAPLAALVARFQPGGACRRRIGAADRGAARFSPAAPRQGHPFAARQGAARARTRRRRGFCARRRCQAAGGGPPPDPDRRCPRQRRHAARRCARAAPKRRGAGVGAHLGACGPRLRNRQRI